MRPFVEVFSGKRSLVLRGRVGPAGNQAPPSHLLYGVADLFFFGVATCCTKMFRWWITCLAHVREATCIWSWTTTCLTAPYQDTLEVVLLPSPLHKGLSLYVAQISRFWGFYEPVSSQVRVLYSFPESLIWSDVLRCAVLMFLLEAVGFGFWSALKWFVQCIFL